MTSPVRKKPGHRRKKSADSMGEFALIDSLFAPLTAGEPRAFSLQDAAAELHESARVVSKDVLIAGVHFPVDQPLDIAARKALRVNLSDMAAMGAKPVEYLLGCAWPGNTDLCDIKSFVDGLAVDQATYRLNLLGGDTTRHAGSAPLVISVTMLGAAPKGGVLNRSGARQGDDVFVSGTIGDARLGLSIALGDLEVGDLEVDGLEKGRDDGAFLLDRYQLPSPRIALGGALSGIATSAIDISDGLIADAGHIARTSAKRLCLQAEEIPVSAPALCWIKQQRSSRTALGQLVSGGDDYELLFTASPKSRRAVEMAARLTRTSVARIGTVKAGSGVELIDEKGAPMPLKATGYSHFS